ncbi:MAG: transcriptional regulator [Acidobacteriales bacterium]|nr:transcriptional regulator [Terriglobales bacterium]
MLHEPMRLCIVHALSVNSVLTFSELKQLLETTDGNLSVHVRKLEQAGYISCSMSVRGPLPRTRYCLTPRGKRVLEKYLDRLEAILRSARTACS